MNPIGVWSLLCLWVVGPLPAVVQKTDDAGAIRQARARSNDAIAAHKVQGIVAELDSTYQITAGSGRFIQGRLAMGEAFAAQFREFPDAVYVRTPESVEVAEGGARAFETGSWVGTWTTPGGPLRTGGRYSASWSKASGSWRIHSELFVTLFCKGAGCS
jgi:ketosteroid isomerase-like protein